MASPSQFMIFGHRGAAALEPENTVKSFKRAVSEGVDGVEFDVRNINGHLLVLHDDTLQRTAPKHSGKPEQYTFEQLREIDVGKGQNIPTLDEAIESIPFGKVVNIELKGAKTGALTALRIRQFPHHRFMVSSFLIPEIQEFQNESDSSQAVEIALLRSKLNLTTLEHARNIEASALNLSDSGVKSKTAKWARDEGLVLNVYTVNRLSRAQELKDWGVAGVFTDSPDAIKHEFLN